LCSLLENGYSYNLKIEPMSSHILQVAYYLTLRDTRALMLQLSGYRVTSVLGNQEAMELSNTTLAEVDLVVVGPSAPYSLRESIVHWLKTQHPRLQC
jgi:hypothetical protein